MGDQRAFDFGGADAVARDVEYVVDSPHDPKIAILVLPRAVAREVDFGPAGKLAEVLALETIVVPPECPQHRRPRLHDDEFAAAVARDFVALVVHHLGDYAEKRPRARAR